MADFQQLLLTDSEKSERPFQESVNRLVRSVNLTPSESMWLFTKHGFFSVVCARKGRGEHEQPIDPDRLMVRARLRDHLETLKARFPGELGEHQIHESSTTDYAYRMFVAKPLWSEVMEALTKEIEYDNFKSEVSHHQGRAGGGYEDSLHEVWSVMYRLQG